MPVVPFGDFLPDAAALGNPGSVDVRNVFPGLTSYKPVPSLVAQTNALDSRPRGAITARAADGNIHQYAGDASKLYELAGSTWGDISKVGGYTTALGDVWSFVQWKNKILATNGADDPQQIAMGDAIFSDLTTDFTAKVLGVVGNFVVAGNTTDTSDDAVPNRIRWSAFNNETDWTVSPSTLSDFRDLQAGGAVQQIIGGEYGVVLLERSTWRMSFVGAPTVFQLDEVLPGLGAMVKGSVVRLAETVYYLSEHGFVSLQAGASPTLIGAGKIDGFVFGDMDEEYLDRWSAVADIRNRRVIWAYPGSGNTGGRPNRMVVYDRVLDKFTLVDLETEMLWRGAAEGLSLDQADEFADNIDAPGAPSLDSSIYKGGAPQFSAFNESFESAFFAGPPLTARIETREAELSSGRRTHLNAFRPLVDGGTVMAQVGTRDRQSDPVVFGPELAQSASGRFTTRANARYHRARLTISGDWKDAVGIQIEPQEARPAERRG